MAGRVPACSWASGPQPLPQGSARTERECWAAAAAAGTLKRFLKLRYVFFSARLLPSVVLRVSPWLGVGGPVALYPVCLRGCTSLSTSVVLLRDTQPGVVTEIGPSGFSRSRAQGSVKAPGWRGVSMRNCQTRFQSDGDISQLRAACEGPGCPRLASVQGVRLFRCERARGREGLWAAPPGAGGRVLPDELLFIVVSEFGPRRLGWFSLC